MMKVTHRFLLPQPQAKFSTRDVSSTFNDSAVILIALSDTSNGSVSSMIDFAIPPSSDGSYPESFGMEFPVVFRIGINNARAAFVILNTCVHHTEYTEMIPYGLDRRIIPDGTDVELHHSPIRMINEKFIVFKTIRDATSGIITKQDRYELPELNNVLTKIRPDDFGTYREGSIVVLVPKITNSTDTPVFVCQIGTGNLYLSVLNTCDEDKQVFSCDHNLFHEFNICTLHGLNGVTLFPIIPDLRKFPSVSLMDLARRDDHRR